MTKPSLYASRPTAVTWLLAGWMLLAAGSHVEAQEAPCAACIAVTITPGQALALPSSIDGLDVLVRFGEVEDTRGVAAALEDIERRAGRPGILVSGVPERPLAAEVVRAARTLLFDIGDGGAASERATLSFLLRQRITEARAAAATLSVGVTGPTAAVSGLLPDIAPYVDFVAWREDQGPTLPGKPVWRLKGPMRGLRDALAATGEAQGQRWLWDAPSDVGDTARLLSDLVRAARWLPPGLIASPTVAVSCGGVAAPAYMNPETLETIAVASGCARNAPLAVTPAEPGVERLDLAEGITLIRVPAPGAGDRFAAGVQVVGGQGLTVEEVIARHQATAARQTAAVQSSIAAGTLTLTFEAPGFPAPVTISSDTVIYSGHGRTELLQRSIRVNGMEFRGGGVPRLPIIEPERVGSPPLAITLTSVYRYRLDGTETVAGTPCYVVAFEPVDSSATLFRGRAWIAGDSFAMVKVSAVQTGLRGPIVASEQTDDYARQESGLWLLKRSDTRQTYEGAAHRTPIHRVLAIDNYELNPTDFGARLQAAYASDGVMLRDTPDGYRYLKRDRAAPGGSAAATEPVIAARADRVRTLAAGVIIDPNISIPLPFAGVSYVDFNLFGTGAQLNAFFGGSYAQVAFSIPSAFGTRWQIAGRGFGIASSYNDRAFVRGREIYEENVRQRPAHASVWALRPLSPRLSLRAGYELDYTALNRSDSTAEAFIVPADQVVHGARVALDLQHAGWNASAWWNPARRTGWRAWGRTGSTAYDPVQRDFQRYGASLSRSAVLTPGLVARLEAAVMAGQDLDRFSRYSFGTFDNRLRGYPSALIRYDRGGVVRGALAWATSRFVRVDLFADSAMVRDPGFGSRLRNYTGVGAALEAPAPFGTLVAVEWGYGFRGINASGRLGTQVVRLTGYKVF